MKGQIGIGLAALAIAAFQVGTFGVPAVRAQGGGAPMDMSTMMQDCQARHQAMTSAIGQTLDTVTKAKASNDPAQMRAALDSAERALSRMRDDMAACGRMMDMMQMMRDRMPAKEQAPAR